jgi:hypothetical protein
MLVQRQLIRCHGFRKEVQRDLACRHEFFKAEINGFALRSTRPPTGRNEWIDLITPPPDTKPLKWETNLKFWVVLHEVVAIEPPFDLYEAPEETCCPGNRKRQAVRAQRARDEDPRKSSTDRQRPDAGAVFADRRPARLV